MEPRKLTVLRIDDRLNLNSEFDQTRPRADIPIEPVEIFTLGRFDCLSSWKNALQLWAEYQGDKVPDLIIADVHFEEDKDSPLSRALVGLDNNLPTGLSHLKPFAALARARGILLGVGIRTADPMLWDRLIAGGEPHQLCMGYLAAHEIGELAAILGDINFIQEAIKTEQLQPFWDWLVKNTGHDFSQGLRVAVQNYRRRLLTITDFNTEPGIFIMPNDLIPALNWCSQMERNPQPLDAENDCGLILTYRDGRRDCVSMASMFADVDGITTRLLPSKCFQYPLGQPPRGKDREVSCKLDWKRQPRIGLFLQTLGELEYAYQEAFKKIIHFQIKPDQSQTNGPNLRKIINNEDANLIRGLVMVFLLIELEQEKYNSWKYLFENSRWSPKDLKFSEELASDKGTLQYALLRLCKLIRELNTSKVQPFLREEVFENANARADTWKDVWVVEVTSNDMDRFWLKWHFTMLVEANVLSAQPDDSYLLIRPNQSLEALKVPTTLSNDAFASAEPILSRSLLGWLQQVLGFEENYAAIGQTAYDAFVFGGEAKKANEKRKRGDEFMAQLLAGHGPGWLIALGQQYATEKLRWLDQSTWPTWLRPKC